MLKPGSWEPKCQGVFHISRITSYFFPLKFHAPHTFSSHNHTVQHLNYLTQNPKHKTRWRHKYFYSFRLWFSVAKAYTRRSWWGSFDRVLHSFEEGFGCVDSTRVDSFVFSCDSGLGFLVPCCFSWSRIEGISYHLNLVLFFVLNLLYTYVMISKKSSWTGFEYKL